LLIHQTRRKKSRYFSARPQRFSPPISVQAKNLFRGKPAPESSPGYVADALKAASETGRLRTAATERFRVVALPPQDVRNFCMRNGEVALPAGIAGGEREADLSRRPSAEVEAMS
jgi:hypothetical protein